MGGNSRLRTKLLQKIQSFLPVRRNLHVKRLIVNSSQTRWTFLVNADSEMRCSRNNAVSDISDGSSTDKRGSRQRMNSSRNGTAGFISRLHERIGREDFWLRVRLTERKEWRRYYHARCTLHGRGLGRWNYLKTNLPPGRRSFRWNFWKVFSWTATDGADNRTLRRFDSFHRLNYRHLRGRTCHEHNWVAAAFDSLHSAGFCLLLIIARN